MKNLILPFFILLPIIVYCQYNPHFSQRINSLEFINPGYNALRKSLSIGHIVNFKKNHNNEYVGGHLSNINLPIPNWNIGFSMTAFTHQSESGSNNNLDLISYVDLKITRNSNLGFGIMGGLESNKNTGISDGENSKNNMWKEFEKQIHIHGGFGINFSNNDLELGASFHYNQLTEDVKNQSEHYTLFLNGCYLFELDADLDIKPSVLYQYWNKINTFDYGLSLIYEEFFTLGIYNRWKQSLIFYTQLKIVPFINLAFSYDLGINKENKSDFGYYEIKVELIFPSKGTKQWDTFFGI